MLGISPYTFAFRTITILHDGIRGCSCGKGNGTVLYAEKLQTIHTLPVLLRLLKIVLFHLPENSHPFFPQMESAPGFKFIRKAFVELG